MSIEGDIRLALAKAVQATYGLSPTISLQKPKLPEHGDYATSLVLLLAKDLRKRPLEIAEELKKGLSAVLEFARVEIAPPGYLNFFVQKDDISTLILRKCFANEMPPARKGKILVEHTSVNPNKAMHVGHLRNAVLGDSIARLLKRSGYSVEVHNYIDDTGVQVADTTNAVILTKTEQAAEQSFDDYCWDLYSEINKRYEDEPSLIESRKEISHALESGEGSVASIGKEVVRKIVECHLALLERFGITYDLLVYESDVIGFGFWEDAFEKLKKSPNFFLETEGDQSGCWVLRYEDDRFGNKIFVRSDGTKVYTAKDTAYHLWKFGLLGKDFSYSKWPYDYNNRSLYRTSIDGETSDRFGKAERIINIIDERQTYPQEMVRHALKSIGFGTQADSFSHIAYSVVSLSPSTAQALGVDISDGKGSYTLSGRKGIGVKVSALLELMTSRILEIQQNQDLAGEASAHDIAVGALKHYLLKYNPTTEIVFDYQQALSVNGDTGCYLQYSHARACSILDKGESVEPLYHKDEPLTDSESELLLMLDQWEGVLEKSVETLNIASIADYAFLLSKAFHIFYQQNPVMKASTTVRSFRLTLVTAYANVIKDVLSIMGIAAPRRM